MRYYSFKNNRNKTIIIIFIVVAILVLVLNKGFWNLIKRKKELIKQKNKINQIKSENKQLKEEIPLLKKDKHHIEYSIRKDLGYIKKGEIEYRFKKTQ